ncbi:hypothetical protein IWW54_004140 [Coemansia sp. RSA 2705]|nr:hypothetical protein IWW54_004140 [Coemansia sp. RSA 2705]
MEAPTAEPAYLYQYTPGSQPAECAAQSADPDATIFRSVEWSPDGTMLAASTDSNALRLYDLNGLVTRYSENAALNATLAEHTQIAHGGPLLSYAWYPYMSRHDAATCCVAESVRDHPVQLRDTGSGGVRASYAACNNKDVLLSASAVAFSRDARSIYAGYAGHIARFDVQRPGLPVDLELTSPSRRSRDGMKGIVSCLAAGAMLACGTFGGQLALHSAGSGLRVWRVPDAYRGGGVTELRWAPNGVHVWAGSRHSRSIVAWDVRDLRGPWAVVERDCLTPQRMQFGFDATGRHLAAGEMDGRVAIHDIDAPERDPVRLQAHADLVAAVSPHPYYPLLATASGQRRFGPAAPAPANCVRVWSLPAGYHDSAAPGEMTRLNQFMADCMSVGALRGFKHFSAYIRSREEIVLRVFKDPDNPPRSDLVPICSSTVHEHLHRVHAGDETKQLIAGARGRLAQPFDVSDASLAADAQGVNFLIAGYQRYRCPYVWLRTDHERLVQLDAGELLDRDAPVELNTINCWRNYDIRPWDVIVEIVCYALDPWPENPFAIDYAYFDKIPIEERVVATGAMLEFLRRAYLRRYFCSEILLEDIKRLQRQHFHCLNALREYQQSAVVPRD